MELHIILLAAGKGTRMKSNTAKVLHRLCGTSMIRLTVERALSLHPHSTVVVVGFDAVAVRRELHSYPVKFVHQRNQLGTGHATRIAMSQLKEAKGNVLILYGDTPMLEADTLSKLVRGHVKSRSDLSLLTAELCPAGHYGRILRSAEGQVVGIVEARDASPEQLQISEFNPGIYCVRAETLRKFLPKLKNNNAQGEYLLTDVLGLVSRSGGKISDMRAPRTEAVLGINNPQELAACSESLRQEKIRQLMDSGVQIMDPKATYIDWYCRVAPGTTIYPHVLLEGKTEIGTGSIVRSFSRITNCRIGPKVTILESSILVDSEIGAESSVGPGAHIRAGSIIGESVRIGNYVEVKNSRIGHRTKAAHLTYLGDATIGDDVNIGAGTITCNYDGIHKYPTHIENGVFIGSDSQLIAPVRIGAGAYVAAGSTITENVPARALAIARGRQIIKPDWVRKRKKAGGVS